MKKILIIEDEPSIAELEKDYLELSNFEVQIEGNGREGLKRALQEEFDMFILDLMLPDMDGFDICREIRREKNVPILMVSAKKDDIDKIRGLGLGADDYITKPFSPSELVARVKAHLARYETLTSSDQTKNDEIKIRGIRIDKSARRVWVNDEEKSFTSKEFDLLTFLAENPNRVFSKEELFSTIWEMEPEGYCKAVRTAHRHGIKEISNYILFNYKDEPKDLYERLRVNIELNEELGIQIFSFPMKYAPISETDRTYIGANWCKKSVRAVSAILQVTKGVVAAGSGFFYKAFGNDLDEYYELLAMPRDLIMFRSYFEENGTTAKWQTLYRKLDDEQKERLMNMVSLNVSELRKVSWPDDLKDILEFYLIKYSGKKEYSNKKYVRVSLMDDSDVVIED